jgi:hypothetical protein
MIMNFKKYPKIRRIGHEDNSGILEDGHVVVKEKLDGGNFRLLREGHLEPEYHEKGRKIVFGSRNVEYKNEKDIDKNFAHAVEYVREKIDFNGLLKAETKWGPLIVFGEAMHPHTLEYNWEDTPSFISFDVYAAEPGMFLDWDKARNIIEQMSLPITPVVYEGPAAGFKEEYGLDKWSENVSSAYRDGLPEGVVIRNEDTGQTAKLRTQQFKEAHGTQSVTDPDDYEPSDSVVLARKFTTEARVLKMIHKYENRGRNIEMSVMEDLWGDVFEDIIEEEFSTIFFGNYEIDTKEFRSEVASITADVLQSYLQRPKGSVLNEAQR